MPFMFASPPRWAELSTFFQGSLEMMGNPHSCPIPDAAGAQGIRLQTSARGAGPSALLAPAST